MSRIPFLILSFLDFVVYVVMTLIFPTNQRKCASSSKKVAILLLLFKRAITTPNELMNSQHYKRHRRKRKIEFHSRSHSVAGLAQCQSIRLPPMWPGFDSRAWRHKWAEFVGSLLCSERFFSGYSGFPLSSETKHFI